MTIAIVFHPLEFIRIPAASFRTIPDLRRQMLHAMAQIVFEVFPGGDSAPPGDAMVIAAYVHQRIRTVCHRLGGRRRRSHQGGANNSATKLLPKLSSFYDARLGGWVLSITPKTRVPSLSGPGFFAELDPRKEFHSKKSAGAASS